MWLESWLFMDGATLEAYKKMFRVIVHDTQIFCLKMEPIKDEED
jgi:hypothetical protein